MIVHELKDWVPLNALTSLRERPFYFLSGGNSADNKRRYSFAGADPFMVIHAREGTDPFLTVSETLKKLKKISLREKGPFPFNGGAVGYFSYDLGQLTQTHPAWYRAGLQKRTPLPESFIAFYDPIIVADHDEDKVYIVTKSLERVKKTLALMRRWKKPAPLGKVKKKDLSASFTKEGYIRAVLKAKEYIENGDIYQINIAQRLSMPWIGDPFSLYLSLIEKRPALYGSFMDLGNFQIISNSPERLLKVEAGVAITEPIKGTRKRGKNPNEDISIIEELKKNPKENAEHVMIVDLERNDLGAVSEPGTVHVSSFKRIETFRGLHHMVSSVKGKLKNGIDSPMCLRAIFPGGSITGAPKVRAMEIINELEPETRGIYTGGIGWMDFSGDMDIAMAIRTAIYRDNSLSLWVGSGIVADSIPEDEYEETLLKAEDFLTLIIEG
ncbi:MAG: anthranilate synthase component I family protein [Deltaproteobacteria bacterium]|nr:anthranilate synthase component I family protein [Deltaproteobacteria bacterium]